MKYKNKLDKELAQKVQNYNRRLKTAKRKYGVQGESLKVSELRNITRGHDRNAKRRLETLLSTKTEKIGDFITLKQNFEKYKKEAKKVVDKFNKEAEKFGAEQINLELAQEKVHSKKELEEFKRDYKVRKDMFKISAKGVYNYEQKIFDKIFERRYADNHDKTLFSKKAIKNITKQISDTARDIIYIQNLITALKQVYENDNRLDELIKKINNNKQKVLSNSKNDVNWNIKYIYTTSVYSESIIDYLINSI